MSRSSFSSGYEILSNRAAQSSYDDGDDADKFSDLAANENSSSTSTFQRPLRNRTEMPRPPFFASNRSNWTENESDDEYSRSLPNRTRRFRQHEQHNEPLPVQPTYLRPPARHASPNTPRVGRRSWSQIEAEAKADQGPDRSLVPAQRSTNIPSPDPALPVHVPRASNPIRRFPAIDHPVHMAQPGYSPPRWPTQQPERRMQVTPPGDKVQHTEHPQYAQEQEPEGLRRNDQVEPDGWQKNEDQHSCPLDSHPIPADFSPETQSSGPSIRRVDLIHDPSRATNDLTVQLEMELEEDWETDLDEFCRLYRLGRFKEAKEYYRLNLTHVDSIPYVRVHYAEMLISCGDYQTFQALERLPEFDAGGLAHKPEERDRGKLAANFELLALLSQAYAYKYIETAWKVVRNTLKALQHEKVMGSTEIQLLALSLRVIHHLETRTHENLLWGPKKFAKILFDWGQLYRGLVAEEAIWEFKDFVLAAVSVFGWKETASLLYGTVYLPDILKAITKDWMRSGYDEPATLGLLDLFTALILQDGSENMRTRNRLLLQHARVMAELIQKNDEELMRSRPFVQWLLAKSLMDLSPVPERPDGMQLDDFGGIGLKQGTGIQLPIYIAKRQSAKPHWDMFFSRSTAAQRRVVELAIQTTNYTGDYALQTEALKLLILQSQDPRQWMDALSCLQYDTQRDIEGYLATCLSRYLVSSGSEEEANLLLALGKPDSVTAWKHLRLTEGENVSLSWARCMVQALLEAETGNESHSPNNENLVNIMKQKTASFGSRLPPQIADYARNTLGVVIPPPSQVLAWNDEPQLELDTEKIDSKKSSPNDNDPAVLNPNNPFAYIDPSSANAGFMVSGSRGYNATSQNGWIPGVSDFYSPQPDLGYGYGSYPHMGASSWWYNQPTRNSIYDGHNPASQEPYQESPGAQHNHPSHSFNPLNPQMPAPRISSQQAQGTYPGHSIRHRKLHVPAPAQTFKVPNWQQNEELTQAGGQPGSSQQSPGIKVNRQDPKPTSAQPQPQIPEFVAEEKREKEDSNSEDPGHPSHRTGSLLREVEGSYDGYQTTPVNNKGEERVNDQPKIRVEDGLPTLSFPRNTLSNHKMTVVLESRDNPHKSKAFIVDTGGVFETIVKVRDGANSGKGPRKVDVNTTSVDFDAASSSDIDVRKDKHHYSKDRESKGKAPKQRRSSSSAHPRMTKTNDGGEAHAGGERNKQSSSRPARESGPPRQSDSASRRQSSARGESGYYSVNGSESAEAKNLTSDDATSDVTATIPRAPSPPPLGQSQPPEDRSHSSHVFETLEDSEGPVVVDSNEKTEAHGGSTQSSESHTEEEEY